MSQAERNVTETDSTRRTIFIVIGVLAALLVAGVIYLTTRPRAQAGPDPQLEGATRPGSPGYETYKNQILVKFDPNENATEGERALGDIVMTLTPTVTNLTNRTISGIELRAAVIDLAGNVVKQRTVIPVPNRQAELAPNRSMNVPIMMEGFKKEDVRANARVELTGFKFKQ